MSLDDIVSVSITAESASPTRPGFGTPLLACYHTGHGVDRVLEYASLTEMVDDGWTTSEVGYKMASRVFGQNPRPSKVKIGRRANAPSQAVSLEVTDATVGRVLSVALGSTTYSYTVAAPGTYTAVKVAITSGALSGEGTLDGVACTTGDRVLSAQGLATDGIYEVAAGAWTRATDLDLAAEFVLGKQVSITQGTVNGGKVAVFSTAGTIVVGTTVQRWQIVASADANLTSAAVQLATLIDANADVTALATGAAIACTTGVAGTLVQYKNWSRYLEFTDTSTDPGIAADLAAIALEDNDWYGLTLDTVNTATALAAAEWVESNGKIAAFTTCDQDSAINNGLHYELQEAAYARSGGWQNDNDVFGFTGAAILGDRFPYDPGGDTWAFKTLAGVSVDRPTGARRAAILAANGSLYNVVAGINVTEGGTVGSGEYYDIRRGIDWLQAEIQIDVFALLANAQKVPYTDKGVDMVKSVIDAALKLAVRRGLLVEGSTEVTAPAVADVSTTDRGNRLLPDVTFTGDLQGAIHAVRIAGTLSV